MLKSLPFSKFWLGEFVFFLSKNFFSKLAKMPANRKENFYTTDV
jgi:hypothetical protein